MPSGTTQAWLLVLAAGPLLLAAEPDPRHGAGVALALATVLPAELPATAVLATWERISGRVETASDEVTYDLYVNPELQAIYQITHYRHDAIVHGPGGDRRLRGTEKLIWNSNPRVRAPLRCFERIDGAWRSLEPGTEAYLTEMAWGWRVYMLESQRQHGLSPPEPRP